MTSKTIKQQLNPLSLIKQGWQLLVPNLNVLLPAVILGFALMMGALMLLIDYLTSQSPDSSEIELMLKSSAMIGLVFSPLEIAITMFGVKLARGQQIKLGDVFSYLPKAAFIILLTILSTALIQIGFYLIVPGIFLIVALSMAPLLVCDKHYSIFKAMIESVKLVSKYWFSCTAIYLLLIGLILLSFLTMGLALIITAPLYVCVKGLMYNIIFSNDANIEDSPPKSEFEA